MEQREKVVEWRLSRQHGGSTIRLWIESDIAFGGVGRGEAVATLENVLEVIGYPASCEELAEKLFFELPFANSVEVCNAGGDGCTIHRDWP